MNDNIKEILDGRRIRNKLRKAGVYPMVGPRGSKDDKGDGISILGDYTSYEELINNHPPGKSEKISVGRVSSGSEAIITDNFDGEIHTLDFVIPKGEKGDKGDIGPKGRYRASGRNGRCLSYCSM